MTRRINVIVSQPDAEDVRARFKSTEAQANIPTVPLVFKTGAQILWQTPHATAYLEVQDETGFEYLLTFKRNGNNLVVVASFRDRDEDSERAEAVREQIQELLNQAKPTFH